MHSSQNDRWRSKVKELWLQLFSKVIKGLIRKIEKIKLYRTIICAGSQKKISALKNREDTIFYIVISSKTLRITSSPIVRPRYFP